MHARAHPRSRAARRRTFPPYEITVERRDGDTTWVSARSTVAGSVRAPPAALLGVSGWGVVDGCDCCVVPSVVVYAPARVCLSCVYGVVWACVRGHGRA